MWHGARFSQPTKLAKLHSRSTYAVGRPPRRIRNKWTGYIKWSLYNGKLSQNGKALQSGSNSRTTRRRKNKRKVAQTSNRPERRRSLLTPPPSFLDGFLGKTNHRTRPRVTAQLDQGSTHPPRRAQVASHSSARPRVAPYRC